MIGQTISHHKILEKLGEVPNLPASVFSPEGPEGTPLEDASPRAAASLSIPPLFGGSGRIHS